MAIIKKSRKSDPTTFGYEEKRLFEGRVLRVKHGSEYRNVSDTMDYSDWQTVKTVWALVWLGTRGLPPRFAPGEVVTSVEVSSWDLDKVRDLTIGEQYAWIDCSNIFADRYGYALYPEVDSLEMQLLHGGPEMIEGLAAWEAFHTARREQFLEEARKAAEEREAAEAAEAEKKAAREAKKAAREVAQKAEAENLLRRVPEKGSKVTVQGVSGTIAWMGVTKHYGKFNARVGVRPEKGGEMIWVDAKEVAQEALTAWERL